jgi:DNA (cytosine-5)-methyltransferase 1
MVLREGKRLRELALFAGAGGGILGGLLHGWRTVAAVEIEEYPRAVLLQRQLDGCIPRFPVWDDIRTFDGKPWLGRVDIVTGGFPCQDISAAGRGEGLEGKRSGLWSEMARVISEVGPRYVLVENSPMLTGRGLDRVLMDLATMGYNARWGVLGAIDVGAPHRRERVWIVADAGSERYRYQKKEVLAGRNGVEHGGPYVANTNRERPLRAGPGEEQTGRGQFTHGGWWATESDVGRVAHGVANRVDRIKAIGNGQVPAVAALAWRILTEIK